MPRGRRKTKKDDALKPVDQLPEFRATIEWAEEKRRKLEEEMEQRTRFLTPLQMERLLSLPLEDRQADAVRIWEGIPVAQHLAGSVGRLIEAISLLPEMGENVTAWWLRQISQDSDRSETINFYMLREGYFTPSNESDRLLKDVLRTALAALTEEKPGPEDIAKFLKSEQLSDSDNSDSLLLSDVLRDLYYLEGITNIILLENPEGEREVISGVVNRLNNSAIEYTPDTGDLSTIEMFRDVLKHHSLEDIRSCVTCNTWILYDDDPFWSDFDKCMRCKPFEHLRVRSWRSSNERKSYTQILTEGLEPEPQPLGGSDVVRRLAFLNGLTSEMAFRLLKDENASIETESDLEMCPASEHCRTTCGRSQFEGIRLFPTTDDGQFTSCRLFNFMENTKGMNPEDIEALAESLLTDTSSEKNGKGRRRQRQKVDAGAEVERTVLQTSML